MTDVPWGLSIATPLLAFAVGMWAGWAVYRASMREDWTMNIAMTDETVVQAFRAAVLQSMTPELQAGVISHAVEEIMKREITRAYGRDRNWLVEGAMQDAVSVTVKATFAEFFAREDNQTKLRAAAEQVAGRIIDKLGEALVEQAAEGFLRALAEQYRESR